MRDEADGVIDSAGLAAALGLAAASLVGAVALNVQVDGQPAAAAVFPPWWSQERAIVAASEATDVLGVGGLPFVVIVAMRDGGSLQDLRATGALLLLSSDQRAGCLG